MEQKAHEKLRDWLRSEGRKKSWLAQQAQVRPGTVTAWVSGESKPSRVHRGRIEELTGGWIRQEQWS